MRRESFLEPIDVEVIMIEFDSMWYGAKRSRYVARLLPTTVELIKHYGIFYGIDPDQLIDSAVNRIMVEDAEFLDYVRGGCKPDWRPKTD
jgi:hypothetical protein